MRTHVAGLVLATVALAITGCRDQESQTSPDLPTQPKPAPAPEATVAPGVYDNLVHNERPRVGADIAVTGSLQPQAGVTITVTATANEVSSGGTVRVTLPELEEAKSRAADGPTHYSVGVPIPAAAEWQLGNMAKGGSVVMPLTVTFPAEGYYRISVVTHAEGPGGMEVGRYLFNDGYAEVWALVTKAGGQVTARFDPALIPQDIIPQPGPFVRRLQGPPREAGILGLLRPLASLLTRTLQSSDSVYLNPRYYDGTQYQSAVGSKVFARLYDPVNHVYLGPQEQQIVPPGGIVRLWCPYTYEWHVQIDLPPTTYTQGRTNIGGTIATGHSCGVTIPVYSDAIFYQIWNNLNTAIPVVNSFFGYSRSAVAWGYDAGSETSYYSVSNDVILMGSATFYVLTSAGHEYGHALHNESLGGLWAVSNCANHSFSQPSSYTCALAEGFADYVGDAGAGTDLSLFENVHYPTRPPEVEGNIEALLIDLIDAANEPGDDATYPPFYVATVFKTCNVLLTRWQSRNDVSDLVWCLENRVDPALHQQRFPGLAAPLSAAEGASEPPTWNPDDVRSTWVKNVG